MRKLGLVGGMGPESTVPYYHDIVHGVRQRAGSFPLLTIESVDVFHVLQLEIEGRLDELVEYLGAALDCLAATGTQVGALCANTPHIVFDRLQERCPFPLVSIVEATCGEAQRQGFETLGLFGTAPTMEGGFYQRAFAQAGMQLLTPNPDEQRFIAQKISDELELGVAYPDTLAGFAEIAQRMREEQGIQAVVLGCTELPLVLNDEVLSMPCLDTMRAHIGALIDAVVAG